MTVVKLGSHPSEWLALTVIYHKHNYAASMMGLLFIIKHAQSICTCTVRLEGAVLVRGTLV